MCGMMYALELLKNKSENLHFINVSDLIYKYSSGIYVPRAVAELPPEKLGDYIKLAKRIDKNEQEEILKQWKALKNENSQLRIFKEGKVISVSEDYFDVDILKSITKEGLKYLSNYKEAIEFWNNREKDEDIAFINDTKNQGRMEERIEIAKKLMDVLDIKIISEKTGLSEEKIKNL